jgi:hypothetical protein
MKVESDEGTCGHCGEWHGCLTTFTPSNGDPELTVGWCCWQILVDEEEWRENHEDYSPWSSGLTGLGVQDLWYAHLREE